MKHFFVINPMSRNGRSGALTGKLLSLAKQEGISLDYEMTTSLEHAFALSKRANEERYDVVVAVGGDGTINRVLNGFFNADGQRISCARMGVIHTGTSPDFCKSYGIPRSLEGALHAVAAGTTIPVRVGRIACTAPQGSQTESTATPPQFFGCCANIGLGAALARAANSGIRRYAGDFAGTFLSLMNLLRRYRPGTVSLNIDGNRRTLTGVYDIAVGRTRYIASGIQVRNAPAPLDATFYVLTVKKLSPLNIAAVLGLIYGGKEIPAGRDYISLEYGARIWISGGSGLEVEFDGDPAGVCPCVISASTDPLELIIGDGHAR
ncbi:MAG TPA: diacylglycerol kinase family protein [Chitinivibrionales bacterium]|nr:diacylglycerol kinase family protein [Chitinivibrionales bacterium]